MELGRRILEVIPSIGILRFVYGNNNLPVLYRNSLRIAYIIACRNNLLYTVFIEPDAGNSSVLIQCVIIFYKVIAVKPIRNIRANDSRGLKRLRPAVLIQSLPLFIKTKKKKNLVQPSICGLRNRVGGIQSPSHTTVRAVRRTAVQPNFKA